MSQIRVTYSGLIALVVGLSSVITGMVFILIVTRNLTPQELGTWGLIGGLITYVIILEPMISYWTTREIARGTDSGKTAVVSSGLFSIVGFLAYFVIAFFVSESTGTDTDILFFAAILIPFSFLNRTLSAIATGWKPHLKSYGMIVFDVSKILAGIIFIYYLDLGIIGAISATIVAFIPSIVLFGFLLRSKLRNGFRKDYLKNWLKRAWLPSYIKFPNMVVLDVLVFSLVTGSVVGLAYWIAAATIGSLVDHSSQMSRAVYPKLLSGGKTEFFQENLIRLFYFAFLFMGISMAFAKPGLFLLNPIYDIAMLVVVFITIRSFLKILGNAFGHALQGIEKVDTKQSTIKEYLKSNLFYLPTIRLIRRGVYLSTLAITLFILIQSATPQIDLVIYWSVLVSIIEIPFTIYLYYLVRKNFSFSLDMITTMKYLLISSCVFASVYLLMEEFLVYEEKVLDFIPNLIPFLFLGVLAYLALTYLVDKKTRKLFKKILIELSKRKKQTKKGDKKEIKNIRSKLINTKPKLKSHSDEITNIPEKNKPNILFIVIDSFRADKFHGLEKTSVTPNLDSLIKKGVYFSNTIPSAPSTIPSICSIFTGNWPFKSITKTGVNYELDDKNSNYINRLNDLDYATIALIPKAFANSKITKDFDNSFTFNGGELHFGVGKQVIDVLDNLTTPWFFYVHLFDIHGAKNYPENFKNKKFGKNHYEQRVSALDVWLGKIINQKISLDNTLVVITSDHSIDDGIYTSSLEQLRYNIGKYRKFPHSKKFLQFVHPNPKTPYKKRVLNHLLNPKFDVFDNRFQVPLLFVGNLIPNGIINQQIRSVDIFPTIYEIITSNKIKSDGVSLLPLMNDKTSKELPAYLENTPNWTKNNQLDTTVVGIRYNDFKYFRAKNNANEKIGLYNLKIDPHEENNLANKQPDKLVEMEKILSEIINDTN